MINSSLPFFVITNVEEFLYEITRVDIRIFPVNNTAKKKKTKQKQKKKRGKKVKQEAKSINWLLAIHPLSQERKHAWTNVFCTFVLHVGNRKRCLEYDPCAKKKKKKIIFKYAIYIHRLCVLKAFVKKRIRYIERIT